MANPIASHTAEVAGVKLHYLTAGHGPALVLLHGYVEPKERPKETTDALVKFL